MFWFRTQSWCVFFFVETYHQQFRDLFLVTSTSLLRSPNFYAHVFLKHKIVFNTFVHSLEVLLSDLFLCVKTLFSGYKIKPYNYEGNGYQQLG